MTNQEIRAFALLIAEVKNNGNFSKILNGKHSIVELTERQSNYLAAIERYIEENNHRPIVPVEEPERYAGEICSSSK